VVTANGHSASPIIAAPSPSIFFYFATLIAGAWGSVVVKALRYQSDGPRIDSRWCHRIFK
jgi:hypothetical protein